MSLICACSELLACFFFVFPFFPLNIFNKRCYHLLAAAACVFKGFNWPGRHASEKRLQILVIRVNSSTRAYPPDLPQVFCLSSLVVERKKKKTNTTNQNIRATNSLDGHSSSSLSYVSYSSGSCSNNPHSAILYFTR